MTPIFFQSDWLNEFWDSREDQEDDYRFVYIGPKGSWYVQYQISSLKIIDFKSSTNYSIGNLILQFRTPFHADVFRSYSWSANICGKKKWIFFPPGKCSFLYKTNKICYAIMRDIKLFRKDLIQNIRYTSSCEITKPT